MLSRRLFGPRELSRTRLPAMCDAHHRTARADGGATTLDNLVLLCRRHHVLWHLGKLKIGDLHIPLLKRATTGPPGQAPHGEDAWSWSLTRT